jgi:hypothetical protein
MSQPTTEAFSPNGLVAPGTADGTMSLWSFHRGVQKHWKQQASVRARPKVLFAREERQFAIRIRSSLLRPLCDDYARSAITKIALDEKRGGRFRPASPAICVLDIAA